jgi:MFS family permease
VRRIGPLGITADPDRNRIFSLAYYPGAPKRAMQNSPGYTGRMSEAQISDGAVRLTPWRILLIGMLLTGLGTGMAYAGWHMLRADIDSRRPFPDSEMGLFAAGALIVGPLGIGTMLAAMAGLVLVRGFRLRTLLILIAAAGVLLAVCSGAIRDYLRSWNGYGLVIPVPSFVPLSTAVTSSQWVGPLHGVSGYCAAAIALIVGCLPFLTLPVILRRRRASPD